MEIRTNYPDLFVTALNMAGKWDAVKIPMNTKSIIYGELIWMF